jgi:tetratricopeptide (TPR) repeat protein
MGKLGKVKDAHDFARRLKDQHFNAKIQNIKQLISLGFDEEAYKELSLIQQMKNITVKQHLRVADCFYKLGKYQECLKILNPIEDNVHNIPTQQVEDKLILLNLLGLVYRSLGKEELAVKKWKQSVEINSRFTMALNNLGNHFMHSDNYLDAAKCYWRSKKRKIV